MKLPNPEKAVIPERKLTHYLLDLGHPLGRGKAIFFRRQGFTIEGWIKFADALRDHARSATVVDFQETAYGKRYVLEGVLATPKGSVPSIRSIWIIPQGETRLFLISAYPTGK